MNRERRDLRNATIEPGDIVRVPSGREARVTDFVADRVSCEYLDDSDTVTLLKHHLTLVRKAKTEAK